MSFDSEEYKDEIKLIDKNKISTGGISTNSYDWQTISAGQDNIGKIILTILEFKRLKEKFKDNYFDMIVCGNAISFIQNKENAINEIKRVLKPNGMISIVPIWYKEEPDYNIIKNVNKELGFEINISYEEDWSSYKTHNASTPNASKEYYCKDVGINPCVTDFCNLLEDIIKMQE